MQTLFHKYKIVYEIVLTVPFKELLKLIGICTIRKQVNDRLMKQKSFASSIIGFTFLRQVVVSHATHFYFDHPQEPDPEERGYYWATRFQDTYKTFGYMPDDVYSNIDTTRWVMANYYSAK